MAAPAYGVVTTAKLPPQTEAEFQKQVIELAHTFGWLCAHFRTALTTRGWRTAVQGDGAGFPDCVLVKDRVIFAELKRVGGKPTEAQTAWLDAIRAAGVEAYLWTPDSWPAIIHVLTGKAVLSG